MKELLEIRFNELSDILLREMNEEGFWSGRLSSSALAVAVAVAALHFHDPSKHRRRILSGLTWLSENINSDGSFGDTPESPGNISTSLLVYAALNLCAGKVESVGATQRKVAFYLQQNGIDFESGNVAKTILAHYKTDYTFSVPILTMCALCGIPEKEGFRRIPQLPFELALLPRRFYRLLNLSVVSYAVPALIAVGIVIFKHKKSTLLSRWIRGAAEKKALRVLERSLPESGGFLEAIPLTAFVALSLANSGHRDSKVLEKGIRFLERTQRSDGSWPIDVDLSTWVTSLGVKSLGKAVDEKLSSEQKERLTAHLRNIQNKEIHPFNGTSPGGWGWTSFSGSVPDCDDTPGAMLALLRLNRAADVKNELLAGADWLLNIQNFDGGFPTFSKGWGKLPFDQSTADLTGHCVLALATLLGDETLELDPAVQIQYSRSLEKALRFLQNQQKKEGSWIPLWFGNQHRLRHENPVYGTARVVNYLRDARNFVPAGIESEFNKMISAGEQFLISAQNADGSWGGATGLPGTIEETALATAALAGPKYAETCQKGFRWLDAFYRKHGLAAAPIGLYFASLWYDEKMYPLTFYLEALSKHLQND